MIQLLAQLPRPFLIMGDMNARSAVWNDAERKEKGRLFEEILLEEDVALLNDGAVTQYHSQTDSYSVIDLTLCSPECMVDFSYSVDDELYDSDHYPVHIELATSNLIPLRLNEFNVRKADWNNYERITRTDIRELPNVERGTEIIIDIIKSAAKLSIPRVKGKLERPPMPCWNRDCDNTKREKTRAERER